MREAGVRGVRKSKRVFTTKSDPASQRPRGLVNRRFTADGPWWLWVCDVIYVATWSGFAYVAFVTDVYSRRIVGWNVAATLCGEILPMQALDMAAWDAGGDLTGVTYHFRLRIELHGHGLHRQDRRTRRRALHGNRRGLV
jgi:putative transposase